MAKESCTTLTEEYVKAIEIMENFMIKEEESLQMGMSILANEMKEKWKEMERWNMLIKSFIMDSEKMINKMELAMKHGLMGRNLKENIKTASKMEKEGSCGLMGLVIKENLLMMSFMASENILEKIRSMKGL